MQKCLNDLFGGCCSGKPEVSESTDVGSKEAGHWTISKCGLSPKTCGKYVKFSDAVKPATGLRPARILKAEIEKQEKRKCGSKKKEKKPSLQGSLFE
jgi:hypothetical protein